MIISGCIATILLIIAADLLAPVVCCLLDAVMAWLHHQLKSEVCYPRLSGVASLAVR